MNTISTLENALSVYDIKRCMRKVIPEKTISPSVGFGGDVFMIRAFLYGLVCNENNEMMSSE